jgi:uncharacterized protein YoxC
MTPWIITIAALVLALAAFVVVMSILIATKRELEQRHRELERQLADLDPDEEMNREIAACDSTAARRRHANDLHEGNCP